MKASHTLRRRKTSKVLQAVAKTVQMSENETEECRGSLVEGCKPVHQLTKDGSRGSQQGGVLFFLKIQPPAPPSATPVTEDPWHLAKVPRKTQPSQVGSPKKPEAYGLGSRIWENPGASWWALPSKLLPSPTQLSSHQACHELFMQGWTSQTI